ncbi:hypothetical protein Tco_1183513 [Tanacetum coccineum]
MVFKVDFAKAYDSVRWDYLMDVLKSFGFGDKWCGWIKGSLSASDPLAPYLFILVMESLHLSFSRTVDVGIFKGIQIVGVSNDATVAAATNLGCAIMKAPFKYLGVMVGGNMSRIDAWDETLSNLRSRLSKWKSKTLSIGGRLTLLKSVLGSSPIYAMSLYKVPKSVLSSMEAIRRNFFYGSQEADKNITWVKWSKVLAAKQFGGLGVSSLFSLYSAISGGSEFGVTELLKIKKQELELKAAELEIRRMDNRKRDEALYGTTTDEELKARLRQRLFG